MREHQLSGRVCWCQPEIYAVCQECLGQGGCWKCGDDKPGLLRVGTDAEVPVIIIHRDTTGEVIVQEDF